MPEPDPLPGEAPDWVPAEVRRYIEHTVSGISIRTLARMAGCHASTVLRQIRRIEHRRDDPLVDAALDRLAALHGLDGPQAKDSKGMTATETQPGITGAAPVRRADGVAQVKTPGAATPSDAVLEREAPRILRRLCEPGAVMAVAENMEKAVVVRDDAEGTSTRTAVIDAAIAQAMALKEWIVCPSPGRVSKYRITGAGRAALNRFLAKLENSAREVNDHGFADAQRGFSGPRVIIEERDDRDSGSRRLRFSQAESPLTALSRRRDRDGKPFLASDLVRAGERMREDFELSQFGPLAIHDWDGVLAGMMSDGADPGTANARKRLHRALSDLGPGLGDVALRCCCFLEGLETAEKRLGWSARSGKIVLRIALQRLKRHYDEGAIQDRMIG
ncbi:DUF6456 domain-containing protein [Chachezhania antarctica]|uniref:DUF6456 domain-containing protein n=1 Tax=Chachezhania antarctica TaxID=2340860 RepID=UPI000EB2ED2F|nr:DUF6456 domain-containing protein [Chachezhania antarctica]|tara:strand:- start:1911 stop:3077 length:1167 start_codon:yes stop_codon:yes gene_type:complete